MGVDATKIYYSHTDHHKLSELDIQHMQATVQLISEVQASRAIVQDKNTKIVLAGSGMITGGRVLHYLEQLIEDAKIQFLLLVFKQLEQKVEAYFLEIQN